jgi:hypothetical protein
VYDSAAGNAATIRPTAAERRAVSRVASLWLGSLIVCLLAMSVAAEEPEGVSAEEASLDVTSRSVTTPTPSEPDVPRLDTTAPVEGDDRVELDRLLMLPNSLSFENQERQGHTAEVWRGRFRRSRSAIEEAKADLDGYRKELDEMAGTGGQWQIAPPGGGNQTEVSPMSVKLREDIRRGKEKVTETERAERALNIEADLANVPAAWRIGT